MADNKHIALLLTNLGSPDSTNLKDVKNYLNEFLMDKRVIDYPYWFRFLLMRCLVVPKRAPESRKAYLKIWTKEGSPLIVEAQKLMGKVKAKAPFPVALSMRYQNPTTKSAFEALLEQDADIKEVVVLPLYPQHTMSSYETAVEEVKKVFQKGNYSFKLKFLNPFYNHPDYITDLAETIRPFLKEDYDRILFSFHGLPERHLRKDDERIRKNNNEDYKLPPVNYKKQAHETARLVSEFLNIPTEKYEVSFQSRLKSAGNEWIKPYTVNRLTELPAEDVKKLLVACPAFINDCLETLEEIGMQGKESFENAGGEKLTLIPCINDQDQFAETIIRWASEGQ